ELEAEALRLQIQMRDRVIEEQDQLLQAEGKAQLAKPDGWINVPAKLTRRAPSTVRWFEEDDLGLAEERDSPLARRRHGSGRGYGALGFGNDPPNRELPSVGIGGRLRSASEGPPLPEPPSARERVPDRGRNKSGGTPPASNSMSSAEFVEARPLDVAGRGLGPPRPAANVEEKEVLPSRAVDAEGDYLDARLPVVEGQNLMGALNGLGKDIAPDVTRRPARGRTGRKRQPKADRDMERPLQLQVEASGLRKEPGPEDSQGSGSEREHASSASPHPVVKDVAAERRGLLSKLNKRMKSGENARHMY
ncbi:unnamed protein product, partial [Cladocopium goreaui]